MSEFRKEPISGRWVIIAPERASRPTDFPIERRELIGGFCPFCEGNEDKTPHEVASVRSIGTRPDHPGWRVRVVPNRFPALRQEGARSEEGDGIYRRMNGFGVHEVIIESPKHVASLNDMKPAAVRDVFRMYQERMLNLGDNRRLAYALLFKNVGAAAGATLEHSHTQLVATPVVPTTVCEELHAARRFLARKGACIFCKMIEEELTEGARVVGEGRDFVAIMPFAPRFPFETWVLPRRHISRYEEQPEETLIELGKLMCSVLAGLDLALDAPAYNYVLHTAPFRRSCDQYHWHIEIIPRVTGIAGFEWGTGFYINPVFPESAAECLRQSMADLRQRA